MHDANDLSPVAKDDERVGTMWESLEKERRDGPSKNSHTLSLGLPLYRDQESQPHVLIQESLENRLTFLRPEEVEVEGAGAEFE